MVGLVAKNCRSGFRTCLVRKLPEAYCRGLFESAKCWQVRPKPGWKNPIQMRTLRRNPFLRPKTAIHVNVIIVACWGRCSHVLEAKAKKPAPKKAEPKKEEKKEKKEEKEEKKAWFCSNLTAKSAELALWEGLRWSCLGLVGSPRRLRRPRGRRPRKRTTAYSCTATLQKLWLFKDLGDSNMSKQQVLQN